MTLSKTFCVSILLIFYQSGFACTIFSWATNGEAFAAANEDDYTPFTRIWFNPPTKERFGSVCFGAPDLQIAAAMNEYGLFYDYTAQYRMDVSNMSFKNPYQGDLFFEIIGRCKTVSEALEYLENHDYVFPSQVLLADATGNSVIINPGNQVAKTGTFQINTNFNICDLKTGYKCDRYDTANRMLSGQNNISVNAIKSILKATHQEGNLSTQYSATYDLKRKKILVYLFHDFDEVLEIDLLAELSKGYRLRLLSDFFQPKFAYNNYIENHELNAKESMLSDIRNMDFKPAREHLLLLAKTSDAKQKSALLDVALQLIRNAHNEHNQGKVWDYWFAFPGGFSSNQYKDDRLDLARALLETLSGSGPDPKTKNFELEMIAYLHWLNDDRTSARKFYEMAIDDPSAAYPITLLRSREMINRLKS